MKLSDAIEEGLKLIDQRCRREFFRRQGGLICACTLGCAYVACNWPIDDGNPGNEEIREFLFDRWPEIGDIALTGSIAYETTYLNDFTNASGEDIVDWLRIEKGM